MKKAPLAVVARGPGMRGRSGENRHLAWKQRGRGRGVMRESWRGVVSEDLKLWLRIGYVTCCRALRCAFVPRFSLVSRNWNQF